MQNYLRKNYVLILSNLFPLVRKTDANICPLSKEKILECNIIQGVSNLFVILCKILYGTKYYILTEQ